MNFSWKRPKVEVDYIVNLIHEFVTDDTLDELIRNNVKVQFIGNLSRFAPETQLIMRRAEEATQAGTGMVVNFAVNYGGREEIVHAMKTSLENGSYEVSEEEFESYLYTSGCPSPELIIRTSGEKRLSGFMLWQSANSELWFTDKMWPSFNEYLFYQALYDFQRRKRRALQASAAMAK